MSETEFDIDVINKAKMHIICVWEGGGGGEISLTTMRKLCHCTIVIYVLVSMTIIIC